MPAAAADCAIDACDNPATEGKLCAAHAKRRRRGGALDAPLQERLQPFEAFVRAACELADVDSDDDRAYELAIDRARKAGARWMRSLGYTKTPATDALAERVRQTVQSRQREQRKISRQEKAALARKALPEGPDGQPTRDSGVVQGNARAGRKPLAGSDRAAGAAHAAEEIPDGREDGSGGDSRPGRVEAVRHRARKAGGAG